MEIQPGDIIFYKPTGFIGWAISKLTKSEYSHVALAVDEFHIIEADKFIKSRISDLSYVENIHRVYRVRDITKEQQFIVTTEALTMLGSSYDYSQVFGLFLRIILKRDNVSLNRANKYICSEIIDSSLFRARIPRKDMKHLGDITPQELFDKYSLVEVE
ncbi:enoyl-CoA hydratase/carnithine racemase-like [Bacillus phage Moonbeam]|uniref:Protein OPG091 n=1 Tax=Bacillus phage Moonbeam TaxID=1540091 RepID=A0A0A0RSI9_9CAUD|nr:enoyl-CoA hydratase/carnithine racemase-like [Bacillus phage Moonbeam]AIW03476.1 hypothetical protein CPT_Moonbeam78 [Bacillus phage Moonbeam]